MELMKMGEYDILEFLQEDSLKILEYNISRTADGSLILDIKLDVSDGILSLSDVTEKTSQV